LCTGISSRIPAALLAVLIPLLLFTGVSQAQTLKLSALRLPPDVRAGSWVSYKVDLVSKNRPPRRLTQRLSVVSLEGTGTEAGAWVELKTVEEGKTRTERGFFVRPAFQRARVDSASLTDEDLTAMEAIAADSTPPSHAPPPPRLKLARYQRLTPDGKLYEYSMDEEGGRFPDGDVSAMDMLEFPGRAITDTLAPDTLRVGHKVIPCRLRRMRRTGDQDWEGEDTTYVSRAVMSRTYWRNQWIPVTGFARMVLEVSTERVPVRVSAASDSAARGVTGPPRPAQPADTALVGASKPEPEEKRPRAQDFFYRADVMLTDIGYDAVPEITQVPEPAPQEPAPRARSVIK